MPTTPSRMRERAGVGGDPDGVLAVFGLHCLEVVGDHRGRLVPADALPLAGTARADSFVGILDAVAAVEILELRHAAQADARRVGLGYGAAVDRGRAPGGTFDELHLAVGDVDEVTAGAVAVVGVARADELLDDGRRGRRRPAAGRRETRSSAARPRTAAAPAVTAAPIRNLRRSKRQPATVSCSWPPVLATSTSSVMCRLPRALRTSARPPAAEGARRLCGSRTPFRT